MQRVEVLPWAGPGLLEWIATLRGPAAHAARGQAPTLRPPPLWPPRLERAAPRRVCSRRRRPSIFPPRCPLSGPTRAQPRGYEPRTGPGGDHGEPLAKRIEKGDEAFRAGQYEKAAELFRSVLAGLPQPEHDLCLRLGDALARAPEGAAARGAGWRAPWVRVAGDASAPAAPRDLLGCPRCQRLLHEPVTLPGGLTVCRRCLELGPARRVNVVLSGLLEKCFPDEGRVRRLAGQARGLQRQQQPEAALLRCHQALDMGKSPALGAGPPAHTPAERQGWDERFVTLRV